MSKHSEAPGRPESMEELHAVDLQVHLGVAGWPQWGPFTLTQRMRQEPEEYAQVVRGQEPQLGALVRQATEHLARAITEHYPELGGVPVALRVTEEVTYQGGLAGHALLGGGLLGGGAWTITPVVWGEAAPRALP